MKTPALVLLAGLTLAAPNFSSAADEDRLQFSIGGEIGTTGPGGTVGWRFSDHLGLRAGGNYFRYSDNREIEGVHYDAKLNLQSEQLALDIHPWKSRSFRITIGALFNQNEIKGSASGNVDIDGTTYVVTAADPVRLKVEPMAVNPFITVGGNLFYFDKKHHWAFTGEIGVAYTGHSDITLTGPVGIPLGGLQNEAQQVEDKMNEFPVWPLIKLGVSYSF